MNHVAMSQEVASLRLKVAKTKLVELGRGVGLEGNPAMPQTNSYFPTCNPTEKTTRLPQAE